MEKTLSGKVALITGSGRGIGQTVAHTLASLGCAVALHDVSEDAPAEFGEAPSLTAVHQSFASYDVPTVALTADIGKEEEVRRLYREVTDALGPVDVLVNCAGGDIAAKGGKPNPNDALGISAEDTRAIFDRNLIGTILVCQAFCPEMRKRKQGSVINIGSVAAHFGVTNGVIYAVAKAGIVHYTRCLAAELRDDNVRVNAISPGPTFTARFAATRPTDPAMATDQGLNRYGTPEDIADAVAYLASDSAKFVHGQVLCVDGGMCLYAY
ncbi:MAG: SDR family NAD(P)-dependent oxidoreductase [Armatimonadaceae bacterium]